MKISRLFYLFVVTLGCSSPKVELTEANKIHLENAALFEILENKLDSLHKVGTRENLKMDIQNLMHELEELEDILYKSDCLEEYGSFAGDFNVNGTVKLDVFTYKWQMDGNQSVEQYETISDEGKL